MIVILRDQQRNRIQIAFFCGLFGAAGALFFLAVFITMHVLRADLSPVDSYVSDYANGPYGMVFRSALIIHGFGNLATAIGLVFSFTTIRSGQWGAMLFGTAAVGIILGGLFSIDPDGAPRTIAGVIHTITASISFPIEAIALVFFSQAFGHSANWRPLSLITPVIIVGAIIVLAWLLIAVMTKSMSGLAERAAFAVFLTWEILVAILLARNNASGLLRYASLR